LKLGFIKSGELWLLSKRLFGRWPRTLTMLNTRYWLHSSFELLIKITRKTVLLSCFLGLHSGHTETVLVLRPVKPQNHRYRRASKDRDQQQLTTNERYHKVP
jgi:hypothetical protein